ncbi:hypothetical protein MTR67_012356, partial [Solanum verrucosum]
VDELKQQILTEAHNSRQHDSIWVIVDRVTKSAYFLVNLSTTFHPQTDNFHSSIQMVPYEALYGRRCMSPIGWFEVGEATTIAKYPYLFPSDFVSA